MIYNNTWNLLWPVRSQKEDVEEEKVDVTSVLKNRTGKSVRPKTIWFDCWEEVFLRVNRVSIYEVGRVHYRVDRSP